MIIYLILMYICYIIGKILSIIYKENEFMEIYEQMKQDLIDYMTKK